MIHGVKETEGEKLENRIVDILDEIDEKPFVKQCCRIKDSREMNIDQVYIKYLKSRRPSPEKKINSTHEVGI